MPPFYHVLVAGPAAPTEADRTEESEQLHGFWLRVPATAQVGGPRQTANPARLQLRANSATSTVRARAHHLLQAHNTARGGAWCVTATLADPQLQPASRA